MVVSRGNIGQKEGIHSRYKGNELTEGMVDLSANFGRHRGLNGLYGWSQFLIRRVNRNQVQSLDLIGVLSTFGIRI